MKNKLLNGLIGSFVYMMMVFGGIQPLQLHGQINEDVRVEKLADISQELLQEYFSGTMENLVLECSEGTNLPFNLNLHGEFLEIKSDEYKEIRMLKTYYIRFVEDNFKFSADLQSWYEFSDFFTGSFNLTVDVGATTPYLRSLAQRKF